MLSVLAVSDPAVAPTLECVAYRAWPCRAWYTPPDRRVRASADPAVVGSALRLAGIRTRTPPDDVGMEWGTVLVYVCLQSCGAVGGPTVHRELAIVQPEG